MDFAHFCEIYKIHRNLGIDHIPYVYIKYVLYTFAKMQLHKYEEKILFSKLNRSVFIKIKYIFKIKQWIG